MHTPRKDSNQCKGLNHQSCWNQYWGDITGSRNNMSTWKQVYHGCPSSKKSYVYFLLKWPLWQKNLTVVRESICQNIQSAWEMLTRIFTSSDWHSLKKKKFLEKGSKNACPPPLSHPMREEDHCGEVRRHQNTESVDLLNSQQLKVLMRSWDSLDDQESKSWERRLCFPTKLASVIRNRVGEGGTSETRLHKTELV